MNKKIQKVLIYSGILGPVFYFLLLTILGLLWNGYNPVSTGMSEIGAVDSPFKNIMNYLGFSLLGLSIMVFSFGFKSYFKKSIPKTITFLLLLGGGFFMFLVGFFPCDPQCIDVTITGKIHSMTSTITAILTSLSVIVSANPISMRWGKKWGYGSFCLGILSLSAGPLMFIKFLNSYTGLIQRMGIGFSLLWIFVVAIKILSESKRE